MLKVGSKPFLLVLGVLVLLALNYSLLPTVIIDDCRRKQTTTTNFLTDRLASSDVSLFTPAEIIGNKSHGNLIEAEQ